MFKKITLIIIILLSISLFSYTSDQFTKSLWLHSSLFSNSKTKAIEELNVKLSFYKEVGIKNLYVFRTLKNENKKGWNFLKVVLKIAHKKNFKIHPIVTSGTRVWDPKILKKKQNWLIKDPFGKVLPYLNLSDPEVRKFILKRVKKMLKYNIDGIHLDYIRFPYLTKNNSGDSMMSVLIRTLNSILNLHVPDYLHNPTADNYFSYDQRTVKEFEKFYNDKFETRSTKSETRKNKKTGDRRQETSVNSVRPPETGPLKPGTDNPSFILKQWRLWNASNVTKLVQSIKGRIKKSEKAIPLSAAVMSNRKFALHSLGQEWGKWGRSGLVDVLCPMIYSNDNQWFKERLKGVLDTVKGKCKVYAGIAIKSSVNENTVNGLKEQVQIAKEMGADGVVIFSGNSLTEKYGTVIKEKVKRQK